MNDTIAARTVVDPVCGMTIDPADAVATSHFEGTDYAFCATSCKARFDSAPSKWVTAEPAAPACCSTHKH